MEVDIEEFQDELEKEMVKDWRPIDALRFRLDNGNRKPKKMKKLSREDGSNQVDNKYNAYFGLYTLIRKLKPNTVVETGVQNGCTTEIILGALEVNNKGSLYSFETDNPPGNIDIWDNEPSKYVREFLKDKWTLYIGNSVEKLPEFFEKENPTIDLFHHDSNHSTEHIEEEFDLVIPYMKENGVLCMHDRNGRDFKQQGKDIELVVDLGGKKQSPLSVWQVK